MSDLINNVYLPDFNKRSIRESDAYKLLKDNNKDTSVIEGYENHPDAGTVNFESFDKFLGEGGTKEEWIARHATPEVQKEFFSNVGDFMLETGKDTALSLATAVVNGADVATNLMPLFVKALSKAPYAQIGIDESFLNEATEKQVYDFANNISNNLGQARDYLNEFKKDDNFVSQLVGVMSQDLLYSIPIYNKLRAAGIPKYPAFFISGGIGGAIGIEQKIMGAESTFSQEFFSKDIIELKNLIGIMPNTPEDKIADEVVQALEYGAFSTAIPGIIDAFIFMKKYVPAMTATTGAVVGMTADNEAEGSPIKAIVNAVKNAPVFKSAVVDATTKLPNKGSGEQIFKTISNTPGVKASELKWIGIEDFLKNKKNITKQEVVDFIEANRIDVTEVLKPKAGKDFGMYSDMLASAQTKRDNFAREIFNTNDIEELDFDNFLIKNEVPSEEVGKATAGNERMTFNGLKRNPIGDLVRSYNDPNTFAVDFEDIMMAYKSDDMPGHVEFYIVENFDRGAAQVISKDQFLNKNKDIMTDKGEFVTKRYELEHIARMENKELQKFALEMEYRDLKAQQSENIGSTQFERYTSPGGEDYKELILKYRQKDEKGFAKAIPAETGVTKYDNIDSLQIEQSPHFNEINELAHVRFKTRDLDGKKVLAVEEMQSDLVQAVIQNNDSFTQGGSQYAVKDFPFKNNWYELAIKRLARYAADNGFDAISISKGSVVQDRYNLTKRIDDFEIGSFDLARREVGLDAQDQNGVLQISNLYTFDEVEKEFGKDVLDRIISKGKTLKQADYDDGNNILSFNKPIIIGGEGKNSLYDKVLPAYLKKYGKKFNAKVYDDKINTMTEADYSQAIAAGQKVELPNIPVTVLELSDEMKTGVTSSSQPLFELFGGVSLATWGAQAVSDSMKNNIISQKTN
nr:hypothetical protein [uncultured Mediterranean phage uvMED]